jgi:hypothetical protein
MQHAPRNKRGVQNLGRRTWIHEAKWGNFFTGWLGLALKKTGLAFENRVLFIPCIFLHSVFNQKKRKLQYCTIHHVPWHEIRCQPQPNQIPLDRTTYCHRCLYTQHRECKQLRTCSRRGWYCMMVLLQQYGLCWLTYVIENFKSWFLIFIMEVRANGSWSACWT